MQQLVDFSRSFNHIEIQKSTQLDWRMAGFIAVWGVTAALPERVSAVSRKRLAVSQHGTGRAIGFAGSLDAGT